MQSEFSIGSDPEVLLVDANGVPRSALDHFPGTKETPLLLPNGGTMYADNVNLEFQVPPAYSAAQFVSNVGDTLRQADRVLDGGFSFKIQASHEFDESELQNPQAFMFGCDPEYCVYGGGQGKVRMVNPPAARPGMRLRSCGGHIHIGHERAKQAPILVVKNLDYVVGISCVLLDNDPTSLRRREIYGGAGYMRLTDYGLEYRTPSNFWLSSPSYVQVMYALVEEALNLDMLAARPPDTQLQTTINSHNKQDAQRIWVEYLSNILPGGVVNSVEKLVSLGTQTPEAEWGIWTRIHRVA